MEIENTRAVTKPIITVEKRALGTVFLGSCIMGIMTLIKTVYDSHIQHNNSTTIQADSLLVQHRETSTRQDCLDRRGQWSVPPTVSPSALVYP